MPIYEYQCQGCRVTFDSLERLGTETLPCPMCTDRTAIKIISPSSGRVLGGTDSRTHSSDVPFNFVDDLKKENKS